MELDEKLKQNLEELILKLLKTECSEIRYYYDENGEECEKEYKYYPKQIALVCGKDAYNKVKDINSEIINSCEIHYFKNIEIKSEMIHCLPIEPKTGVIVKL